jgi:hypothetical protein
VKSHKNEKINFSKTPALCLKKTLPKLFLLFLQPSVSDADLFHYNNLLIGPRAIGLAGAFTAITALRHQNNIRRRRPIRHSLPKGSDGLSKARLRLARLSESPFHIRNNSKHPRLVESSN